MHRTHAKTSNTIDWWSMKWPFMQMFSYNERWILASIPWSLTSSIGTQWSCTEIMRMTFIKWRKDILSLCASVEFQRVFTIRFLCQCLVECGMLTAASRSFHAKNVNRMLVYFIYIIILFFFFRNVNNVVFSPEWLVIGWSVCCAHSMLHLASMSLTNSSHYIRYCCAVRVPCVCVQHSFAGSAKTVCRLRMAYDAHDNQ